MSKRKNSKKESTMVPWGEDFLAPLFKDPLMESFFKSQFPSWRKWQGLKHGRLMPRVDLVDNGDSFTLHADMPGVDKKDIKLKIMDNMISISASRVEEKETRDKHFYSRERSSTGYFRNIAVPEEIKADTAKAKYENGTLKIDVKKANPERKSKEIKVD